VTTQAQVLDLLERLVEQNRTAVVLITHNLGVVAEFCERVAVMYAGRFVERARAEHIFTAPTHPYTEALLACVPDPSRLDRQRLPAIPGLPPNLAALPQGCSFEARCPVGHGLDVCVATAPIPAFTGDGPAGAVEVECHFAAERLQRTAAVTS
jgi:oligopeptide/dipeptide ABC transporter ATP-binding protein